VSAGTAADEASCKTKCGEDYANDQQKKDFCVKQCPRFLKMYLNGIVSADQMKAGAQYKATLGGLRNPRNVVDGLRFKVTTYDPQAFDANQVAEDHIIDEGLGGEVAIDLVSPLQSFSASGRNTTNGDETTYLLSWFTDILTESED
jgi:hypothetical protein